jgi:hypothetical protein
MTGFHDMLTRLRRLYERRLEPEYLRVLAEDYWRALLVFALCALIGLILFGVWQFIVVLEDLAGAQNGAGVKPPVAFSRPLLENTLSAFDAREAAYKARGSGTTYKDPSKQ